MFPAIPLIPLVWFALLTMFSPREAMPAPARRALGPYLLAIALWAAGTLASWLLAGEPGAGALTALPALVTMPAGVALLVWANQAWRLPRLAQAMAVGGLAIMGLAGYLATAHLPGLPQAPLYDPRVLLAAAHGLGALGLGTYLAWQQRPKALPERASLGHALFTLLATLLCAALAYGAHRMAGAAGAALIVAVGLMLTSVVVAFPGLGETLGLWIERTILHSQYAARSMVKEVAVAAPAVLELEPLVGMILERTMQTLAVRWGLFALWDRSTQELHAAAARGLTEDLATARWRTDHPLTRWLLEGPDLGDGDRRSLGLPYSQPAGNLPPLNTAWIVPVRLREEPIGVFLYGPHTSGEPYSATERTILDLLTNETAAAVANARLFNQVARARREWLQTFDALSDGVFLHDRQGRILRANRALARLVGRSFDQIISRPWFEVIPTGPEPPQLCPASAGGGPAPGPAQYDLAYAGHRTLHVSVSPLAEGDEFCVHVVRDVTHERALQLQLAQAEKLAAIGEMLSGVAHELNNPLTTIIGFAELLQDAEVPEQVRADLQRIWRQAQRSARIVQSLLDFARQSRIQVAEVDLNTLLTQTLDFVQPQLESRGVQVALELDAHLPRTLADAGQMQQVFLNLFSNALQAMDLVPGPRRLGVASEATPTALRVTITDNGPGIPQALLQRIFDPFFTSKEVGEGAGLGLSICYGIIREHGGSIWAESKPGQGATLRIELPIRRGAPAAASVPGCRILIVEDEEEIVALLQRVLGPAGHQLQTARDGQEGLRLLAEAVAQGCAPDLIVADLRMPRLDGASLYERVRRDYPRLAERFLFISGDVIRPESQGFLDQCGQPYLRKPFGIVEIGDAVAMVLAKSRI